MHDQFRLELQGGSIGAIVSGIDLANITEAGVAFVKEALKQHLVVCFREQNLDPPTLHALAEHFGKPAPYPFVDGIEGFPEIVEVRKLPHETINFGGVWHSDTAYLDEPTMGALLYGINIPDSGGDTIFSNMYHAYNLLSPGLRKLLAPLSAINDADKAGITATRPGQPKKGLTAEHPVIRTHPETGKPLLYVNQAHTTRFANMTATESKPLLDYLFDLITTPEITFRFQWQTGSLAFWDNRACQHYPLNDYQGEFRRMYRISLAGTKPTPFI